MLHTYTEENKKQITKCFQIEDSLKQSSFSQTNSDVNIQSNGMMVVLKREKKTRVFCFHLNNKWGKTHTTQCTKGGHRRERVRENDKEPLSEHRWETKNTYSLNSNIQILYCKITVLEGLTRDINRALRNIYCRYSLMWKTVSDWVAVLHSVDADLLSEG